MIAQEVRDNYLNSKKEEYKRLFEELREKYENDRKANNLFLKDEKVFYISNSVIFREKELFEFDLLQKELVKCLPSIQANVVLSSIKTRSLQLLEQKRDVLSEQIEITVQTWMKVHEGYNFLRYLSNYI